MGNEKVTTKAGSFDALKITATGTIKVDSTTATANVVAWYVKDMGTVKMTIASSQSGSKPVTMTVEATKVD